MKSFEFDSRLAKNEIPIPADLAGQIPDGSEVRVILLLRTDADDDWSRHSLNVFSTAYSEEDSVYESLIDEPPAR